MEGLETYTSVLTVLSVALLLVTGGLGKKQLVWKTRIPGGKRSTSALLRACAR